MQIKKEEEDFKFDFNRIDIDFGPKSSPSFALNFYVKKIDIGKIRSKIKLSSLY